MTRTELLAVAYRFHPRGLFDELPGYRGSEEWFRQREVGRRAAAGHPTFREMLRRLGYSFVDRNEYMLVKSYPGDGEFDPAYSAEIHLPGRTLGFHVCLLGPYYGIYRTGAPSEELAVLRVAQEIEATYAGYEPIPPELGNEVVPDLIVSATKAGRSTIYHCLLSPTWEWSSWADEDIEALALVQAIASNTPARPRDEGDGKTRVQEVTKRTG
jgi:hypothetical protein